MSYIGSPGVRHFETPKFCYGSVRHFHVLYFQRPHPTEIIFPPLPPAKLGLDLATPEGCEAELT